MTAVPEPRGLIRSGGDEYEVRAQLEALRAKLLGGLARTRPGRVGVYWRRQKRRLAAATRLLLRIEVSRQHWASVTAEEKKRKEVPAVVPVRPSAKARKLAAKRGVEA